MIFFQLVLSVRDKPEGWRASVRETVFEATEASKQWPMTWLTKVLRGPGNALKVSRTDASCIIQMHSVHNDPTSTLLLMRKYVLLIFNS